MQAKYVYAFVKSGEKPKAEQITGLKRSECVHNAKVVAERDDQNQDIFRRALEDAEGRKVLEGPDTWEFVNTVGEQKDEVCDEAKVVRDCIKAIEKVMPSEQTAKEVRTMYLRREGMKEAVEALKRHYSLD